MNRNVGPFQQLFKIYWQMHCNNIFYANNSSEFNELNKLFFKP